MYEIKKCSKLIYCPITGKLFNFLYCINGKTKLIKTQNDIHLSPHKH